MEATRLSAPRPAAAETRTERTDTSTGRPSAGKAGGPLGAADFSLLLSGLNTAPASTDTEASPLAGLADSLVAAAGTLGEAVAETALPLADRATELAATGELPWLDLGSLVGQTQRLDQAADTALRNGTHVQADTDSPAPAAPGMQARPMGATWQTAQAGQAAEALPTEAGAHGKGEHRSKGASGSWAAALDTAGDTAATKTEAAAATGGGRFAVAAGMEAGPAPALQAALNQIGNWASSTLGAAGRAESGVGAAGAGTSAVGAAGGVADAGASTELAAPQDLTEALPPEAMAAAEEPLVEDMNYWLNARTQRAELVLDREGQPVRVQVTVTGNEAQVRFSSDQVQTRELLDASMAQLRDLLSQQGLVLTGASVQAEAGRSGGQGTQAQDGEGRSGMRQARIAVTEPAAAGLGGRRSAAGGLDVFA